MPRYLAFVGCCYYPSGGWNDWVGSYTSLDEAIAHVCKSAARDIDPWGHVVDLETTLIVYEHPGKPDLR